MSDNANNTVGELVRKRENDYVNGTTQISKHVTFSMHETLEKIDAYLNSKHVSGETDSLGREKPFFNIVTAAANVWYRATDIDRSDIKIRAGKRKDWLDAFVATAHLHDWMRRNRFGYFLNEWGRVLSRYGSAVVKCVENGNGLFIDVIPWNRLIVDPVDFEGNPKIELIELTESQLRKRIETHGYDKDTVEALSSAFKARETVGGQRKDNRNEYIKIYEVHGEMPKSFLTDDREDDDTFVQQMQVVSFVGGRSGKKYDYKDFTLYRGKEEKDPYKITHLIKEDGRTLSIGAIEHLFQSQWMQNHSMKAIKDQLDVASKLIFQTSDPMFLGRNVLSEIEHGDILRHAPNEPLTQVNNGSHDIVSWQNFAVQWKTLGNEITGVSESMLGSQPKSGTAWRQTEALLSESHSLFELMTENKGLYIEEMMREWVIPHLKKQMNTSKEVSATLKAHDISRIDRVFLKPKAVEIVNREMAERVLNGESIDLQERDMMFEEVQGQLTQQMQTLGNERFFKPSEMSDKVWKEQFKDLEWDVIVDVTGEPQNVQEALTTLNNALQIVVSPGYEQNENAQLVVGKILELTGAMSPLEISQTKTSTPMQQQAAGVGQMNRVEQQLPAPNRQTR